MRWINADYNTLLDQLKVETDSQRVQQMFVQLNDVVVQNYVSIPLIDRYSVDAKSKTVQGPKPIPVDDLSCNIADWTRSS